MKITQIKNRNIFFVSISLILLALAVLIWLPAVQAANDYSCNSFCTDVEVGSYDDVTVDLDLTTVDVPITIWEASDSDRDDTYAFSDILAENIYIDTGYDQYYCSNDTDEDGYCLIENVPTGEDFELNVLNWYDDYAPYSNLPYTSTISIQDSDDDYDIVLYSLESELEIDGASEFSVSPSS